MTRLNNTTFVCLDCEFTGLSTDDRILEVACVRFTLQEIIEQFELLVNPEHPISPEAQKVHGISQDMVGHLPPIKDALPRIFSFVGTDIIVGHAINLDLEMLEKECARANIAFPLTNNIRFDTLRLARSYGDSQSNSLSELAKHFHIEGGKAHRAMNDVMINIEVFKFLIQRFTTIEQLQKLLSHPIQMKYMPLGKHKGRLFSEIPLQYLQWAAKMEFDQDLLYTIRLELRKRNQGERFSQASNPFSNL